MLDARVGWSGYEWWYWRCQVQSQAWPSFNGDAVGVRVVSFFSHMSMAGRCCCITSARCIDVLTPKPSRSTGHFDGFRQQQSAMHFDTSGMGWGIRFMFLSLGSVSTPRGDASVGGSGVY